MDKNGRRISEAKIHVMEVTEKLQNKGFGVRHQQCFILFICLTTAYAMRSCMGVALVAMVENDIKEIAKLAVGNNSIDNNTEVTNGFNISDIIHNDNASGVFEEDRSKEEGTRFLLLPPYPHLHWSKQTQDLVLSSFQWGYMCLQIPAGELAHRFGTRYLLTGALFINGLVSFCTPWAAFYGGWILTILCRVLQGLSQACIVPGMHRTFGRWAPLEERSRLTGFAFGGQALGTVLGLPITGFLAASPLGWPGIFRFYGLLSTSVAILLWFTLADTPAQHPKISAAERRYIEDSFEQSGKTQKHLPIPWSKILRCRGLYAIVVAHIGQTWGQLTLYTEVPAFMAHVMGVNIKANGLLTALPFMVMWITNFFFNWFTDMLIVKKFLSVTNARKVANSLGCVPSAIGLVALAFAPKNLYVVETILVLTCAFKISAHVGFQINHIDIAPNFAGTLMSISNFVSNLCAAWAPVVAGYILTDVNDPLLWRKVFLIAAGLYFFTNLVYVILGTAEKAEWNDPHEEMKKADKAEKEPMMERKLSANS